MSEITNEQKLEIKQFAETLSAQYTDFLSLVWEALGLSERSEPHPNDDKSLEGES